jgi:hypothetical protein
LFSINKNEAVFNDSTAAKRFDQLDFIMINVDSQVMPWMEKSV